MSCLTGIPQRLHIIQGPDNITVAQATEVSMHCTVSGFPVPMVHWFKDGCLMTNSSASFSLHNNGQLLTITSGTCFFFLLFQIVMINQYLSLSGNINPITLMFSGMSPKRMKAGITAKHSTRKSQSSLIQPFFFQLVIVHILYITNQKACVLFLMGNS